MELIKVLEAISFSKRCGRKQLRRYGINDELKQPLGEISQDKAIRIVMNWLTLNTRNGHKLELRISVPEEQMV